MFHRVFMLLAIVIISAVLVQKRGREGFSDDDDNEDEICISGFCFTEENLKSHINEMDLESRKRLASLLTS